MDFAVLGPLQVHRNGRALTPSSSVLRQLLAVLLCQANQVVLVGDLAELLWAGSPPRSGGRKAMQVYIHRLRQQLGQERILHEQTGYRLVAEPSEVDWMRFTDVVQKARSTRDQGDFRRAGALYERGLRLWRGEPYADVATNGLVADEAHRLTEQRLLVLEEAAGVDLDLGSHTKLVAELQQMVRTYPFREQLSALLMLALYRCGRQAEALDTFRDARTLLHDELGIEPGTTLQRLHEAVLRADPQLERLASGSLGGTWESLAGRLASPAEPVTPRQLPIALAGFSGRHQELEQLDQLHQATTAVGTRLAVITGTGGVGKTALAVHWAHRLADNFPDGQLYINLRGFDPSGQPVAVAGAVREFLDAFAVPPRRIPASLDGQLALYRSIVAGKRVLVLLDNAPDADHARPLLPGSAGSLTIVTSRDQLTGLIVAEGAHPIAMEVLSQVESRELLARRLGAQRTAAEPVAVDDLIRSCARLPLALAIVAARAVTQPRTALAALAAQLRSALPGDLSAFATGEAATDIRTVLSWSYQTLTPAAARLFRLLGLHPGPDIGIHAAASLAAVSPEVARGILDELAKAQLITQRSPDRYSFHDILRAYATGLVGACESTTDRNDALHRVLDHYLHTIEAANGSLYSPFKDLEPTPFRPGTVPVSIGDGAQARDWFDSERANLVENIRQAAASGWHGHAWHLGKLLVEYLDRLGYWQDWISIQQAALDAAHGLRDRGAQGLSHRALARVYDRLGQHHEARGHIERALTLSAELHDDAGQARTCLTLATTLDAQGEHAQSLDYTLRALDLAQRAGDTNVVAIAVLNVAFAYVQNGDPQQALVYCERALDINEELNEAIYEAAIWENFGEAYQLLGHYDDAIASYRRSLDLYEKQVSRHKQSRVLDRLGDCHQTLGNHAAARQNWQQAVDLVEGLGHHETDQIRVKLAAHR